jgi:NSS family neurotransmitter:Na+ symporter
MCTLFIMFYYSVVTGWCLQYLLRGTLRGFADLTPESSLTLFTDAASGPTAVHFHAVAIFAAAAVVFYGVTRGIERACKILIPALLVVVVIMAVRALTLPGAERGLEFMFKADLAKLGDYKVWLEALSQSAWSTGAGWGLLLCYAIYAPRRQRIGATCVATGIGNNLASVIAALAIIPAVFALMPMFLQATGAEANELVRAELQKSGPGLTGVTFVWVPVLLQELHLGGWEAGRPASIAFFLTLSFAAISSLIAMVELGSRLLIDFGLRRRQAVLAVATAGFLLGIPSALSMDIFMNQDWVWGLGLILSGGFLAFGVVVYGVRRFREVCLTVQLNGRLRRIGRWFDPVLALLIPLQFLCLMGWWFWQAYEWTAAPDRDVGARLLAWLDPTGAFSIGTCLIQWGMLLAIGLILNRWLAARSSGSAR